MSPRKRSADLGQKLPGHVFEGLSHTPDSILPGRVHVGENPKNARTARRPRRKRINVQQPIVLSVRSRLLVLDESRAETGTSLGQGLRMPRKQSVNKFTRESSISRYRSGEFVGFRACDRRTSQPIRGRVVTDVLSSAGPPARREEMLLNVP